MQTPISRDTLPCLKFGNSDSELFLSRLAHHTRLRKSFHRGGYSIEKMSNGHSDQRELDSPPLDEGEGRGSPASEMKIATRPGFFPSGRVKPKQNRALMHFLTIATGIEG
jgi:hypothetical protein